MKNMIFNMLSSIGWNIFGDFKQEKCEVKLSEDKAEFTNSIYDINLNYKKDCFGVYRLGGNLVSKNDVSIHCLDLVLNLGGGEFEVYSQYNSWQNESTGGWQDLITSVFAEGRRSRTSSGAAPFMAVWNKQTNRGMAFHLIPQFAWEMKVKRRSGDGELSDTIIEIGINKDNLCLNLKKGEAVNVPDIIFYEFKNKLDMDCFKLHNYWHNTYNKKPCPVTYNTWLSNFDDINYENVSSQIKIASQIGAEYFVIDAGWFGKGGDWFGCRGDWKENLTGALCGSMIDISNEVRKHNMKFGLWFEIESASINSDIVKEHRDYFIIRDELCFLDFSNAEAREYIIEAISENIEKYGIEYIKFDYNQDMYYDGEGRAFIDYLEDYNKTIQILSKKHPDVFFENCASGGKRINLSNCIDFDGFWPSDNESPYEQLRMFKDTVLRLPPQYFDRWVTIMSIENFTPVYSNQENEKIIACNDATWDGVVGVHQSFLNAFLLGGQIGFSCDLTKFSDELILNLKNHVAEFKKNREFWDNAVCRILASTDEILVLQYSDIDLNEIKIVVFTYKIKQNKLFVYPVLDDGSNYVLDGEVINANDGIEVKLNGNYRASVIEINKK